MLYICFVACLTSLYLFLCVFDSMLYTRIYFYVHWPHSINLWWPMEKKKINEGKREKNVANNFRKERKKPFQLVFPFTDFPIEIWIEHATRMCFFSLFFSSSPLTKSWTSECRVEVLIEHLDEPMGSHKNTNQRNAEHFHQQLTMRLSHTLSLCVSGLLIKYNQVNADTTSASFEFSKWIAA